MNLGLTIEETPQHLRTEAHGAHKAYRCTGPTGCGRAITYEHTKTGCPWCGNHAYRIAVSVTDEEMAWLTSQGFDPGPDQWTHQ